MKRMNESLLLAAIVAVGVVAAGSASAATLTNNGWEWLHSQPNNSDFHNISVFAGSAGYMGQDPSEATTSGTFGDGTVEAYAFFTAADGGDGFGNGNESLVTLASGGSSITGSTTDTTMQNAGTDGSRIWETTDPNGFTTSADYPTDANALGVSDWSGSIDISSYSSGTIYIIYGVYRGGGGAALDLDLTMTDDESLAPDILLLDAGSTDQPNNWEHYVVEIGFENDLGYDSVDYVLNVGGGNGRVGGIVVDGIASAVPEPASLALLGIGGLMLCRRRRD